MAITAVPESFKTVLQGHKPKPGVTVNINDVSSPKQMPFAHNIAIFPSHTTFPEAKGNERIQR